MKLTMVMVQTINGKITQGNDPHPSKWASGEDQKHFYDMLAVGRLLIMGSTTFDATPAKTQPNDRKLRVVITRDPGKYSGIAQPDRFEFTSDQPTAVVQKLESRGYTEGLLIGGGKINSLFLKEKLVTDISLTVEPKIFGLGKPVVDELEGLDVNLKLFSSEKLNQRGTLLLHYEVLQ